MLDTKGPFSGNIFKNPTRLVVIFELIGPKKPAF